MEPQTYKPAGVISMLNKANTSNTCTSHLIVESNTLIQVDILVISFNSVQWSLDDHLLQNLTLG